MKTYRIKHEFAFFLMGLQGLYLASECSDYVKVDVFNNQDLSNFGAGHRLTSLPKNCDNKLITAILEKMQCNKATFEGVKILKEYLQYAEKKDKNNEIKSDIKASFKKIFFGLLLIAGGGVGGLALTVLLMGLYPAIASWIAFIIIPVVAAAIYGVINALVGCLKLGIGIFSLCFRQKNTEQLPALEDELRHAFFQPSPPPPSYQAVMGNKTTASAPILYSEEPPTFDQAVKNSTSLSTRAVTPPVNISASVLPYYSAHFFHHPHSVSNNRIVNDNSPSVCRHYCN